MLKGGLGINVDLVQSIAPLAGPRPDQTCAMILC